jgi:hypothetical protein
MIEQRLENGVNLDLPKSATLFKHPLIEDDFTVNFSLN